MSETPAVTSPEQDSSESSGLLGALLCLVLAAAMWAVSYWFPKNMPIAVGWELWWGFLLMLIRDTLRAGGVLAVGAALACVSYRRLGPLERRLWTCSPRRFLLATSLIGFVLCLWLAKFSMQGVPHIADEVSMLFQTKNFALGQLYAKPPAEDVAKFFEYEFIVTDGPRWYGKYFFGPSLALLPGLWIGMPWLINPILGALSIIAFYVLGRDWLGEKAGRVAALLAALSPFRLSTYSVMMSHGGCLLLAMIFAIYLIRFARDPRRYRYGLIAGVCLGAMINYRPLTAAAMALPLCLAAAAVCHWRQVRPATVLAFFGPLLVSVAAFFAYNKALTGDAKVTPFTRCEPKDKLGFGEDLGAVYWHRNDRGHDLQNMFKNLYLNIDGLGINLLGWGRGTLLLMAAALLVRSGRRWQLLGLATILGPAIAYCFYYASGSITNLPRYWSEAMGFMILLTAGGLTKLRMFIGDGFRRFGWRMCDARARTAIWVTALVLTVWNLAVAFPALAEMYGETFIGSLHGPALIKTLKEQPLENAVVFLPTNNTALNDPMYTLGFSMNSPNLDDDILYVRDYGNEKNKILLKHYPNRKAYRFVAPLDEPARFEAVEP